MPITGSLRMQSCKGCRQQQTNDTLCLACIEDLSAWLRSIPDLYVELGSVRLPGSVPSIGPRVSRSLSGSPSPIRLEVLDLLDRGETLRRLWEWTDDRHLDVRQMCDGFRHHLLSTVTQDWAGDFWRAMRSLCRDLGRAVGEPEDRAIGKCSNPTDAGLCRGQLFRTEDGAAVYCRRCGDKPALTDAAVWVSLEQAARLIGRPLETVRTWYKRGKLSWSASWAWELPPPLVATYGVWSCPIGPQPHRSAWLPSAVRLANGAATTLPPASGIVNHGSGAELSAVSRGNVAPAMQRINSSGSDTDVLGRVAPGNVTPSEVATSGKAVASDPSDSGSLGRESRTLDPAVDTTRPAGSTP